MEFTHERFGKCELAELTQKQLEDFHRAMKGKENEVLSVWRGDSVRVAAKQGLLIEPKLTPEDIDNAKPSLVTWLSECIAKLLSEAMRIDPLS
jgi:hypothetical protein